MYPLFIVEGENVRKEISSMPSQFQLSIDNVLRECEELKSVGVCSVILFGIPNEKDEVGSGDESHALVRQRPRPPREMRVGDDRDARQEAATGSGATLRGACRN